MAEIRQGFLIYEDQQTVGRRDDLLKVGTGDLAFGPDARIEIKIGAFPESRIEKRKSPLLDNGVQFVIRGYGHWNSPSM